MKQMAFDEILVQNILDGSEDAFVVLYDRYRKQVYVVAYRILRHPEDAQDAMQEIFVKIHRSLHKWNAGKSRLATWIYRLAINHSIDCCRMRRRQAESQIPLNYFDRIKTSNLSNSISRSPYRALTNIEAVDMVRRCIVDLPVFQRKIFMQRFFHEKKLVRGL